MHILRRLPFRKSVYLVEIAGEPVAIRPFQIVVWVSLTSGKGFGDDAVVFPAILDTGHGHNFSISENHLVRWAGHRLDQLPKVGAIRVNQQEVPLLEAHLWLHRNRPGTGELLPKPFQLPVPEGISVFPTGAANSPRLPLVGLRGLMQNELRLVIDAMSVSLHKYREATAAA